MKTTTVTSISIRISKHDIEKQMIKMWRRMSLFFTKIYLIIFRRQIQCTWHTSKCEGLMCGRLKGRTSCYDEVELVCVKGNRVPVGMPEMSRWYLPNAVRALTSPVIRAQARIVMAELCNRFHTHRYPRAYNTKHILSKLAP